MKNFNFFSLLGFGMLVGIVACSTPPSMPPQPQQQPPHVDPSSSMPQPQAAQSPAGKTEAIKNRGQVSSGAGGELGDVLEEPAKKRATTVQERVLGLDEALDKKLTEFDGLLLEERITVKAEHQGKAADEFKAAEQVYGYAGAVGGSEPEDSPPPLPRIAGGEQRTESGGGSMPNQPPQERKGDYEHDTVVASIPPDIPRGDEEDVVARQLREAALQETDPELRQKLWDEYRRYKGLPVKK
jgi:hypothetical protein